MRIIYGIRNKTTGQVQYNFMVGGKITYRSWFVMTVMTGPHAAGRKHYVPNVFYSCFIFLIIIYVFSVGLNSLKIFEGDITHTKNLCM